MRKKLEERRQKLQREAAALVVNPPKGKEMDEDEGKALEPRKQWGEPVGETPVFAQQGDATGVIRDGESMCVGVCV